MALTNAQLLAGPTQVRSPAFGDTYISTVSFDIEAPLDPNEDMGPLLFVALNLQGNPGDLTPEIVGLCDGGGAAVATAGAAGLQMVLNSDRLEMQFRRGSSGAMGQTPAAVAGLVATLICRL